MGIRSKVKSAVSEMKIGGKRSDAELNWGLVFKFGKVEKSSENCKTEIWIGSRM